MKKRKIFTHPPVAMERLRDTQYDLLIRLIFVIVLAVMALTGFFYLVTSLVGYFIF